MKDNNPENFDHKGVNPVDFRTPLPYETKTEGDEQSIERDREYIARLEELESRVKKLEEENAILRKGKEEKESREVNPEEDKSKKIEKEELPPDKESESDNKLANESEREILPGEKAETIARVVGELRVKLGVDEAREEYLKASAGRKRWFRRGSKKNFEKSRENYRLLFINFAKQVAEQLKELGLSEEEITGETKKLLISETLIRTAQEVEIANDKKSKRVLNWFKNHPKLRMFIGGALTMGVIASGATGAFPLSAAFLGARSILAGASAAVATEGGLDWAGEKRSRKRGRLSGTSKESINEFRYSEIAKLNSKINDLSYKITPETKIRMIKRAESAITEIVSRELDERLAAQLAHSIRKGEMPQADRVEYILTELANNFETEVTAAIEKNPKKPEKIRANFLERYFDLEIEAMEGAHNIERTRSIQRSLAAGALGLVAAAHTLGSGLVGYFGAKEAQAATECIRGYSISETVGAGDGEWTIANRGLHRFMDQVGYSGLNQTQETLATEYIRNTLGDHALNQGGSISLSGNLLNEAYNYAKSH